MSKRGDVLELAVLGLLHESPMHGYELRKRLNTMLGSLRAFSYGSLYPCLKAMVARGWLTEEPGTAPELLAGKRSKIVYKLTADGKEHFQELLASSGPDAWEDENFGVHFAFFGRTDAEVRMRILEGRRSRLEERMEAVRGSLTRTRERLDSYTLELQRHGLESAEREVRWLNELIRTEHAQLGRAANDPGRSRQASETPTVRDVVPDARPDTAVSPDPAAPSKAADTTD
jgi:DNA-binding PadR family transcriptional regulator